MRALPPPRLLRVAPRPESPLAPTRPPRISRLRLPPRAGFLRGWRRAWFQGSTDHRGTPAAPGRVVTLIPDAEASTYGAAYRVAGPPERRAATLAYLEWREKQYDLRARVEVWATPGAGAAGGSGGGAAAAGGSRGDSADDEEREEQPLLRNVLCYIATSDTTNNPYWAGPASLEEIAATIASASGPSGDNRDYVFALAAALRAAGPAAVASDPELFELEARVAALVVGGGGG